MLSPPSERTSLFDVQASPRLLERFAVALLAIAGTIPYLAVGTIAIVFVYESWLFFREVPILQFFTDTQWTPFFPSSGKFGIWVLVSATLLVSAIAMIVAMPIGLLSAIYLSECAPRPIRSVIRPLLDSLSGVPTVEYGYFALTLVTPYLQGFIPNLSIFNGLSAGIATGLLITPVVAAFSADAISSVDHTYRQAAYACGLTRFEFIWKVILPEALPGIIASFTLAASRALGETMIAAIAAGQFPNLTANPLMPVETMTGFIVQVSLGDVPTNSIRFHTIFTVGMVLFLITLVLNSLGYWLVHQYIRAVEGQGLPTADTGVDRSFEHAPSVNARVLIGATFAPSLFWRRWIDRLFSTLGLLASLVGPAFLGILTFATLRLGLPQLNWQFLTSFTSSDPERAGVLAGLAGTFWLLGLTALFAIPISVAAAICLEEYVPEGPWNRCLEVHLANATAVPGILYGLLGVAVFAEALSFLTGGHSVLSAALMMTLVVLPLLTTASLAALRRVPTSLKQGGYAVGMSRWQVIWHIVLPTARPGLLTGILLTASRVIGETSPLIAIGAVESVSFMPALTLEGVRSPFTTLTTQIFFWLSYPQAVFQEKAAAAVIVLGAMILVMNGIVGLIRDRIQRVA